MTRMSTMMVMGMMSCLPDDQVDHNVKDERGGHVGNDGGHVGNDVGLGCQDCTSHTVTTFLL